MSSFRLTSALLDSVSPESGFGLNEMPCTGNISATTLPPNHPRRPPASTIPQEPGKMNMQPNAGPELPVFFPYLFPNNVSSTINMQTKGSINFALQRNIEMALKLRSYILDLDRFRLSFGIFFFLSYLVERFFTSF